VVSQRHDGPDEMPDAMPDAAGIAADRVVGRRTLLALRVVFLAAVALFFGLGAVNAAAGRTVLTPPTELWALTAAAALAALLVCWRSARRVPELTYSIAVAAAWSAFVGALGLVRGFSVLVVAAVAGGLLTLALLYAQRRAEGAR
jgi:hypothetical protein